MSNYYIDIIDTQDDTHTTLLEDAARSSVVLSYKGGDAKDELAIVGSTLKFTIVVTAANNVDGALDHLQTGDEQRYRVEMRKETDNTLIWHGFILPDDYNEPYKQGTLTISFTATDGLGRLKGKFLPETYYEDENTVTSIMAECLKLTGLSMPFYFCPSIENYHQTAYHTIYIKGTDFIKSNKKQDAYAILEALAEDLLFCVFQSMGYWHLEGLNKRNLVTYSVNSYGVNGDFVETIELTRNIKDINTNALATPNVTSVVPYGIVTVDHDREPVEFLEAQSKEVNDGWAVTTGVNPEIYATEWIGTFYAKAIAPDYNIIFYNSETNLFDISKYVGLRSKLYLQRSEKYRLEFEVQVNDTNYNQAQNVVESWTNPVNYKVTFNDVTLYSNFEGTIADNERIEMVNTKTAKLAFEFVTPENGLLDVVFYEPYKDNLEIVSIQLNSIDLERIGFTDTETFTDTISEDYTQTKDKEITFADDPSGYSKSFRLEKLSGNAFPFQFNTVQIPILYSFTQNDRYYSVVQLDGANLIAENLADITHVESGGTDIKGVIYNYQNNEQMIVETGYQDLTGNFAGNVFYRNQGPTDRYQWLEWSDSLYGVERERFGAMHAKIYRRLFKVPHVKIDLTINFPVLFNDMIRFNYKESGNYTISSLRGWDVDNGRVQLTINKAIYQNDDSDTGGENLPPFVEAGDPIYIAENANAVQLTSSSGDPDGFVIGWQWTQVTTETGLNFGTPSAENTLVTGVIADFYTFQIQVTDNDGATASDTVDVIRLKDYTLSLNEILSTTDDSQSLEGQTITKHYELLCSPTLPNDFNLTIDANMVFNLDVGNNTDEYSSGRLIVDKNSTEIVNQQYEIFSADSPLDVTTAIPFNYNNTDTIVVKLIAIAEVDQTEGGDNARAEVDFNINNITFASGLGTITNTYPMNVEAVSEVDL